MTTLQSQLRVLQGRCLRFFQSLKGRLSPVLGLFLMLSLSACTDGRIPKQAPVRVTRSAPQTRLIEAADIQFDQQDTDVYQMVIKGDSLFMTGTPFGFMRWNVGANAESPELTFAAADQIDEFAPFGKWVLDWYGSGALALMGRYAFTSGIVGTSIVDIGETHAPVEVRRHPRENEDQFADDVVQDEAYIYRAMVAHPTKPLVYGFRQQDRAYLLNFDNRGLTLARAFNYGASGQTVCCVEGATVWNNKLVVAFRSKLLFMDIGESGDLTNPLTISTLQATNVASTARYLYVQHEPNFDQPQGISFPRGIYVFDTQGTNVAFLQADSPLKFAVTSDDSHLLANNDALQVLVYRIEWVNGAGGAGTGL